MGHKDTIKRAQTKEFIIFLSSESIFDEEITGTGF
jgi:hypothetical protein